MKDVLYEVRCLKSSEDMVPAFAGQFKQLSREPEIQVITRDSNPCPLRCRCSALTN